MGYTTDFLGSFKVEPTLKSEHRTYLTAFANTRRMQRHGFKTADRPDPVRAAVGLPVGDDGAYFVGEDGFKGQGSGFGSAAGPDIANYNSPPRGQPGLWCQWVPNDAGTELKWDGGEKFYHYVEWLAYLIQHFLAPWGYVLNGTVAWWGEGPDDRGRIIVEDNAIRTQVGITTYRDQ